VVGLVFYDRLAWRFEGSKRIVAKPVSKDFSNGGSSAEVFY
jgi:hypothetical protein